MRLLPFGTPVLLMAAGLFLFGCGESATDRHWREVREEKARANERAGKEEAARGNKGSEWLKTGDFFPESITGRTKEDSARAVEYLKSVLFDLDLATIDGEVFDSTEVDPVHRARLRWKP